MSGFSFIDYGYCVRDGFKDATFSIKRAITLVDYQNKHLKNFQPFSLYWWCNWLCCCCFSFCQAHWEEVDPSLEGGLLARVLPFGFSVAFSVLSFFIFFLSASLLPLLFQTDRAQLLFSPCLLRSSFPKGRARLRYSIASPAVVLEK